MSHIMLAKMAWRNIWRNRRRTIITLVGIVFGTFLAVIFTGMGDYLWTNMINLAAKMGGGHVSIQHRGYLETPSLKLTVTDVGKKSDLAMKVPHVKSALPRISGNTMLAAGGNTSGAFFLAIDPHMESVDTLSFIKAMNEGKLFDTSRDKGIILGKKLAENLGVKLNRKVVFTMTDKRGEIVSGLARVRGIIKTGADGVDAGLCVFPLETIRQSLGYRADEATQIALFIDDQRRTDSVAAELKSRLSAEDTAVAWHESQPELAGFISMKVVSTAIMEIIIGILVLAGIFNTLFVSVMERRRELGIMLAIGYDQAHLFGLVMWESVWIALSGLLFAFFVTAGPYYYLSTTGIDFSVMLGKSSGEIAGVVVDPWIKVVIFPESAMMIAAAVFGATLFAGLYPAWRASRLVPVETIKLV